MRDITPIVQQDRPNEERTTGEIAVTLTQMEKAVKAFLSGFGPGSRPTIRSALRQAADVLGWASVSVLLEHLPWHTLTADHLVHLKESWEEKLEPSTISLYMHAVRGIAQSCLVHGLMSSDAYVLLKFVKVPKSSNDVGRGRAIERKYRDDLINNCLADDRLQGVRDAAIIALLFGSGIRRSEASNLLDQNINLDAGEIVLKVKGGKTVTKHLTAWAIPHIKVWRDVRRTKGMYEGRFFNRISKSGTVSEMCMTHRGIYYVLEQRSIRANLPFLVKPHDARRTMGTEMIEEHGELIAQRVLGHASLSTTKIYDKRTDKVLKEIFKSKIS
ncbi:hypothetical protein ALQ64_03132 [Pseudomonas cannabina]|uniref:Tyr recombinase domain-containing protein n=1 Tax=Pseudomonas cannabina TaxID=86840 RepID=A0A3M3K4E3_PSECA|nr:tyrosine-type recombinase/integrase [Pseudomonas cannabina]RMN17111.1 hypothetical protein ALQ64_03132 [Pseudomonas cannabina]